MNKKQNIRIFKNKVGGVFAQTLRVAILIQKERWAKTKKNNKNTKKCIKTWEICKIKTILCIYAKKLFMEKSSQISIMRLNEENNI